MADDFADGSRLNALLEIQDWIEVGAPDAIRKVFHFEDFDETYVFVSGIAQLAERMKHYPTLFITTDRVEVRLSTDQVAALTQRDIDLARAIDALRPEGRILH